MTFDESTVFHWNAKERIVVFLCGNRGASQVRISVIHYDICKNSSV